MSERPIWAQDTLYSDVTIKFGFVERLKIFLFGKCIIRIEAHTQHKIGAIEVHEEVLV